MMNDPLVSIIIPVYNCERYLGEAIESVLSQTYRMIEVIVVDDGSTDGSGNVAKRFGLPVKYTFQANGGTGAARNRGVELAQGKFLAFLDQDDLWIKDKLTNQIGAFRYNPAIDIVLGHIQQFYSPELARREKGGAYYHSRIMPGFHIGAMLITRAAFWRVGPFRTDYQIAEFIDWYARSQDLGLASFMLSDVIMRRRIHKTNQSFLKRERRVEYVRALKASLDRRRDNIHRNKALTCDDELSNSKDSLPELLKSP
jgi:glycosyltransferase involved in cell wall biosynthesis